MPRTFTDDIAAALPSSIDGPFLVVDPSDSTNSIKLDPANGQITAGGSARPTRSIALSYVRNYPTTSNGSIGVMTTRSVATGTNGGLYVGQFRIPPDMDVTEPSNVWFLIATGATGPGSAQKVRILLVDTYVRGTGSSTSTTLGYDWPAPVSWALDDNRVVMFDAGSGRTYDGNRFAVNDFVALRIIRNGVHPDDTYSKTIHLAESLIFEYTAKTF
ncbi:MAG: hypothetical protein IH989_02910 [Planctomycetes bacterium]|nr:hypothetical protein [Planctomycetota bacterium]